MQRLAGSGAVFAIGLAFLGYGAGHELVYQLLGIAGTLGVSSVHGYLPFGGLAAACATVAGFTLAARALFKQQDHDRVDPPWRRRAALSAAIPALTFLVGESAELAFAPTQYVSPLLLFAVGVPFQIAIGLFVVLVARFTLRGVEAAVRLFRRTRGRHPRPVGSIPLRPLAVDAFGDVVAGPPLGGRAPPRIA